MEALPPAPPVPTHKKFLRHCWVHHDNCVPNKAFLLGILPFTAEVEGGRQSKEGGGDTEGRRGDKEGEWRGWK